MRLHVTELVLHVPSMTHQGQQTRNEDVVTRCTEAMKWSKLNTRWDKNILTFTPSQAHSQVGQSDAPHSPTVYHGPLF